MPSPFSWLMNSPVILTSRNRPCQLVQSHKDSLTHTPWIVLNPVGLDKYAFHHVVLTTMVDRRSGLSAYTRHNSRLMVAGNLPDSATYSLAGSSTNSPVAPRASFKVNQVPIKGYPVHHNSFRILLVLIYQMP